MSETNESESTCTGCLCGVEVLGSEIRQNPSQHVVYILVVRWSDGSESVIHRQYAEFRNLYAVLVEKLPIETGQICESDKVIPALSGSPWGWQSCIDARQKAIANFCRAVASLPRARRLVSVSNLFRPRPEELECGNDSLQRNEVLKTPSNKNHLEISAPILLPTYRARASYSRKNKMEVSFQQGDLLEVVSKSSSGWWLCLLPPQRGWAPASLLELVDTDSDMGLEKPDLEGLLYEVTQDYERSEADELSLSRGDQVRVIYRPPDGWWVVRPAVRYTTRHHPSKLKECQEQEESKPDAEPCCDLQSDIDPPLNPAIQGSKTSSNNVSFLMTFEEDEKQISVLSPNPVLFNESLQPASKNESTYVSSQPSTQTLPELVSQSDSLRPASLCPVSPYCPTPIPVSLVPTFSSELPSASSSVSFVETSLVSPIIKTAPSCLPSKISAPPQVSPQLMASPHISSASSSPFTPDSLPSSPPPTFSFRQCSFSTSPPSPSLSVAGSSDNIPLSLSSHAITATLPTTSFAHSLQHSMASPFLTPAIPRRPPRSVIISRCTGETVASCLNNNDM